MVNSLGFMVYGKRMLKFVFRRYFYNLKSKTYNLTRGFTLIETLLYLAVLSLIIGTIIGFTAVVFQTRIKSTTIAEVENQGQQTMDTILSTIRLGTAINSPAAGASAPSLSINVYNGSNSPTLFDLSGNTLRMKEGAAAYVDLTSSRVAVSSLNFINLTQTGTPTPPGTVRVSFTVSSVNSGGKNEYDYSKTFTGSASLRW